MIAIPQYLDPDAWQGFEDMRKQIKKPLTDRARKLIVYELHRIKEAGHDPNAALDQSTNHCWCDVFVPKEKSIEPAKTQEAQKTQDWITEHSRPGTKPPEGWAEQTKQRLRRVM